MASTALFRLYRAVTMLLLPIAARREVAKLRRAGIDESRAQEKLGLASLPRPAGPLLWFHGASVGEAKSGLHLIARMGELAPEANMLLTSGTATSASAVSGRLPPRTCHQFAPLDGPGPVARFLDHWRPDLAVLIESELWPNLLDGCARRDVALSLVNARLSDRSLARWRKVPRTARHILRGVRFAHTQDARTEAGLRGLGLAFARQGVNLKSVLGPPLVPAGTLADARAALAARPVWVAASTHDGEEEAVLAAHARLRARHPELLLILVPRHPERGDAVAELITRAGLDHARRSSGAGLGDAPAVYLADTMGETDLWFSMSSIVFVGGSFTKDGGHTPYEPAAAGAAILHGPHFANFREVYARFRAAGASLEVADSAELGDRLDRLLTHPGDVASLARAAGPLVMSGQEALNEIAHDLLRLARHA